MLDARRQSSGSDSDSSNPGSAGLHPQVARSQPQPQGRLLPRGSAGDELHRPPMTPEENAQDLTSDTQAYKPTDFEVPKSPLSSASDGEDMSSNPRGSQAQLYPPKPQKLNTDQSPMSYKYPLRYKPIDTGTYNTAGALPSPERMISGKDFAPEDPHGHAPRGSAASSATIPPPVKAFQTVHDHTMDQLDAEGKEYIPKEIDPNGETKVSKDGHLLGGRVFLCQTFRLPARGETLFMLGTECALVLGYWDFDLLFTNNKSLFKIILSSTEKENLAQYKVIPRWCIHEEIAVVTARSMFRQFGARLIQDGRRVRDDYWEAAARQQGFTADDVGERTPGAARAREAVPAQSNHKGRRQHPWKNLKF